MSENGDFPLVSIITPVYNGSKYIEDLILSVRSQDYPNIEHIIIDDGSQDDGATVSILKRYPHLRWLSRENRGQYATMNEGLEAARGEIICFVSADDLLLPGAVACVVNVMQQQPEVDGVYGRTQFMDEVGRPYPIQHPFQTAPAHFYRYFSHIAHCSLYLKKGPLLDHDLTFDPSLRYVGDYDWILRILAQLNLERVDSWLSKVRIHDAQTSIQSKYVIDEERRRVVKGHRINPVQYWILTGIYAVLHDMEKLRYAWDTDGADGVQKLFVTHYKRGKESK